MNFYLETKDFKNFFEILKTLISKPNQSSSVIIQLMKFSSYKINNFIEQCKKNPVSERNLEQNDNSVNNNDNNDIRSTNHSTNNDSWVSLQKNLVDTLKLIVDSKNFLSEVKSKKKKTFLDQFKSLYLAGKYDELQNTIEEFSLEDDDEHLSSFNSSHLTHTTLNTLNNNSNLVITDDKNSKSMINECNKLKGSVSNLDQYNSNFSSKQKYELTTHTNLNSSLRKLGPNTTISPLNKIGTSIISNFQPDGLKFMKDPKYPFARLSADITLTTNQINKTFLTEMKLQGFQVSGSENSEYCKAEKKQFDFLKSFLNCFKLESSRSSTPNNSNITSLYICTRFSDINKFERIIEICGTSGKKEIIASAIEAFFKKIRVLGKKIKPLRVQDVNSKLLFKNDKPSSSDKLPTVK